jgi:FKBP-type peptidyl-prolyl cis-trans isomerase 2
LICFKGEQTADSDGSNATIKADLTQISSTGSIFSSFHTAYLGFAHLCLHCHFVKSSNGERSYLSKTGAMGIVPQKLTIPSSKKDPFIMCPVQLFDTVSVSYTATLPSGEVIESAPPTEPITLTIGSGRILKAVEASLMGMEPGQNKTVHIQPEDAYGPYHKALVQEVDRSTFAGRQIDPKPGMLLSLAVEKDGVKQQVPATVLAAGNETVTIDYNHPLAGRVIIYTVTLHAIAK